MNTSNPKFWALIGFVVGIVIAAGGTISTPLDALIGGLIQAAIWFGVSTLIIRRKKKKTGE
jgi:threonine/homoserine/homoserine lactone efflux protein